MEKVFFKNSRNLRLVGDFYSSASKPVIIMCHGFTGDKSESGRFETAAEAFNKNGYNVLNFDFSGSGESDDDSLTVAKQVDDLESAIKYIQNKGMNNIALLGLSLGGLVSLKVYNKQIKTMVLWAPVTDKINYSWDKRYSKQELEELGEKGYITLTKNRKWRAKMIIDRQMLKDREEVDQESLCSRIKCPVLIVHGDRDDRVPLQDSKNAIKYLPRKSKLEIIKGADHQFQDKLGEFIDLSVSWFKTYLPR